MGTKTIYGSNSGWNGIYIQRFKFNNIKYYAFLLNNWIWMFHHCWVKIEYLKYQPTSIFLHSCPYLVNEKREEKGMTYALDYDDPVK